MENTNNCVLQPLDNIGKTLGSAVHLKEPPSSKRARTDILFLAVFSIVSISWLALGIWVIVSSEVENYSGSNDVMLSMSQNESHFGRIVNKYWILIAIGLMLALTVAIIFVFLMCWIAKLLVYACIGVFTKQILFFSIYCFIGFFNTRRTNAAEAGKDLILGISSIVVFLLFFGFILAMNKRNRFAFALVNESIRMIRSNWCNIFFPIIAGFLQVAVILFTVTFAANLSTKGQSIITSNHIWLDLIHAFNTLGFLWVTLFISGITKMTLAGAYNAWYWTYSKSDLPASPLWAALRTTIKYNLGTIAFGATTINICHLLRIISGTGVNENACSRLICFRWEFIRCFSENAYIMSAIHGKPLYASGLSAFQLLRRNPLEYISLDSTTEILFGVCKLELAVLSSVIAKLIFGDNSLSDEDKSMVFIPILILAVGAYLIAGLFANIYSIAVDTLVMCFLEDCELNDGSDARPYYMSRRLVEILAGDSATESFHPLSNDKAHYNNY